MLSLHSLSSLFGRRRFRFRSHGSAAGSAAKPDAAFCGSATSDGSSAPGSAPVPFTYPVPFDPPHDFASWRAALDLLGGDGAGAGGNGEADEADGSAHSGGDSAQACAGWESGAIVVLRRGSVDDPAFAGAVMALIERFCTARLAEMTQRFLRDAADARDADSLALLAERYVRCGESLLFFDDVRGLPPQDCARLCETLRNGYRRAIDAPVAPDGALAAENLAYGRLRVRRMLDDAIADDATPGDGAIVDGASNGNNNKGGGSHE